MPIANVRRALFVGCLPAALTPAAAAHAGPDPVHDPVHQPLADGCQRTPAGLLTFGSREGVWVGGKETTDPTRVIEGTTTLTHTADEDLPESHTSYDLDSDV